MCVNNLCYHLEVGVEFVVGKPQYPLFFTIIRYNGDRNWNGEERRKKNRSLMMRKKGGLTLQTVVSCAADSASPLSSGQRTMDPSRFKFYQEVDLIMAIQPLSNSFSLYHYNTAAYSQV